MTWHDGIHILFKASQGGRFVTGTASMCKSQLPTDKLDGLDKLKELGTTGEEIRIRYQSLACVVYLQINLLEKPV